MGDLFSSLHTLTDENFEPIVAAGDPMLSLLSPSRHICLFVGIITATALTASSCVPISLPLLAVGAATQVAVSQGWHSSLLTSIRGHLGQQEPAQPKTQERRLPEHCYRVEGGTVCVLE